MPFAPNLSQIKQNQRFFTMHPSIPSHPIKVVRRQVRLKQTREPSVKPEALRSPIATLVRLNAVQANLVPAMHPPFIFRRSSSWTCQPYASQLQADTSEKLTIKPSFRYTHLVQRHQRLPYASECSKSHPSLA